jgi:hypothetical protein
MSDEQHLRPWNNKYVRCSLVVNVILGVINTILVIISRGWITGLNMAIVWAIIPCVLLSSYYFGWADGQQSKRDYVLKFM